MEKLKCLQDSREILMEILMGRSPSSTGAAGSSSTLMLAPARATGVPEASAASLSASAASQTGGPEPGTLSLSSGSESASAEQAARREAA